MSYLLRGVLMSLGAFFVLYAGSSFAVAATWRLALRRKHELSAAALFALRIFPLAGSLTLVALAVVPSFVRWEPARASETMGWSGMAVAAAGAAAIIFGAISMLRSWRSTGHFVAACTKNAARGGMLQIDVADPVLCVAGVRRPRLLISQAAGDLLTESELRVAVQHELAHVRFRDNLKKLALHFCRFPFLGGLEKSWLHAAELAADDAAVHDEQAALDLASALLKMARRPQVPLPAVAMSLVPDRELALRARVERLLAWKPKAGPRSGWRGLLPLVSLAAILLVACTPALPFIHELTEYLVR